jgi:hypothetical protein
MNSYLVYWKPLNVNWDDPGTKKMRHAASNQFYKVHSGDRLYFITYRQGVFYFVGRILVDRIVGRLEAAKILRCAPQELWSSDYHALADKANVMPRVAIPCEDVLGKVLTKCGTKVQPIKKPFVPARFQSIRYLTPGSAQLFDDLLTTNKV